MKETKMHAGQRRNEISKNFMAFQAIVADYLPEREGEWAVLSDEKLIGVFPTIREAADVASRSFGYEEYSIQRVTDKPVDLGFLSYGAGPGIAI